MARLDIAVQGLFATPVAAVLLPNAAARNAVLRDTILRRREQTPSVQAFNAGGWHSSDDFFAWPDHGVDTLRQAVAGVVQTVVPLMVGGDCEFEVRLASWANVLRYGGYNKRHSHPDCQLSLVYYVRVGTPPDDEAPESGVFELLDPRVHAEMATLTGDPVGRSLLIRPFDGQMSVFPSWMYHQVNPYYGEGERISVAINAHIGNLRRKD